MYVYIYIYTHIKLSEAHPATARLCFAISELTIATRIATYGILCHAISCCYAVNYRGAPGVEEHVGCFNHAMLFQSYISKGI